MKVRIFRIFGLLMILSLAACAPGGPPDSGPSASLLMSQKPRTENAQVAPDDLAQLVEGNSEFAYDLYGALRDEPGNLFLSPHSISLALAMTYGGARAETETQMAETLHYSLPQDRLHPAFNALDQALASRVTDPNDPQNELFRLNIVNAIWGQRGYSFEPTYLDLLAQNYGAGLRVMDFQNAPEESRQEINQWVEGETEERIKDLIPSGAVTPDTRMVLTNAIYFKAAWLHQFDTDSTRDEPFYLLDGSQVNVPFMNQQSTYGYASLDGVTAVELPYEGNQLSMLVLLPEEGSYETFEEGLDAAAVQVLLDAMQYSEVQLSLPKFTFESSFGLKEPLTGLGMSSAFEPGQADFSGMDGSRDLSISDVVHKAFVLVDETGTEAAAATAVIVGVTSAPMEQLVVRVDRPFLFLIRDQETGAVLFLGRVLNPKG